MSKLTIPMSEKRGQLQVLHGQVACYPSCACEDEAMKTAIDSIKKGYRDLGCGGDLTCGSRQVLVPQVLVPQVLVHQFLVALNMKSHC